MILVDEKYNTGFDVERTDGKVVLIATRKSRRGRLFWDWCRVRVPGSCEKYRSKDIPLGIMVGENPEKAVENLKLAIARIQNDDVPF